ncbi:MAG: NigD-like protein [Bacteroidales bacterium]|nr:NigD-like protein [Bacteroidales bacterium]
MNQIERKTTFVQTPGLNSESTKKRGMKHFLNLMILMGLMAILLPSCIKDDDNDWGNYYISYGVVQSSGSGFTILTDEGKILTILENRYPGYQLVSGKRLVVNYTILATKDFGYDVRINELSDLLTKNPVLSSTLSALQQDSIGHDPVEVSDMWFGGEKYLNINFEVYRNDPNLKHFINLVVDENTSASNRKVLQFRHNAYEDNTITRAPGRVSFDVSSLLPDGMDSIKLVIEWRTYNDEIKKDSGYYKNLVHALGKELSIPSLNTMSAKDLR